MSVLFNMPWQQAFDGSGHTLPGARLYFYDGGTSTPKNVYADVGLGVPLTSPVVADGEGRFPPIYLDSGAYKVKFCDREDGLIWTADNIFTTNTPPDPTIAATAMKATSISAGYTEEEANNPTNFVKSIYKYANRANWYVENESSVADAYILDGLDDYTRLDDYFLGQNVWFVTQHANTVATATVNVVGLGAKRIYRPDSTPIEPGDLYGLVHLVYNGSSFTILPCQVNQHGEQTIYNVKTFDESPLVPTPDAGDNSKKAVNTEFLKNSSDNMFKPKYSSAVDVSASTYTAPANGVFYLTPRPGNIFTAVYVDDVYVTGTWGHSGSSHGQPNSTKTILLGKDQVMKVSSSATNPDATQTYSKGLFVPFGNYPTSGSSVNSEEG